MERFPLDNVTVSEIPFCQIHDEDSFESLLIKWTQTKTLSALSAAQDRLGIDHAQRIYMCKGGQAKWADSEVKPKRIVRNRRKGDKYCRPDWAAVKGSTQDGASTKAKNLLPGETKLGSKWSSSMINPGFIDEEEFQEDWFQPISQIFTYCVRNKARYGYLITDRELVVVRVGPRNEDDNIDSQSSMEVGSIGVKKRRRSMAIVEEPHLRVIEDGSLQYRSIPWESFVEDSDRKRGTMTVNLALWWLHMMAADSNDIQETYGPLKNCWSGRYLYPKTPEKGSFTSGLKGIRLDSEYPSKKRVSDSQETNVEESPRKRKASSQ